MQITVDARAVFPGMGGIGRYAHSLIACLPAAAPASTVTAVVTRQGGGTEWDARIGLSIQDCAMIDERWDQLSLPALLAKTGPDIYHGTCFTVPIAQGRCRSVVTVHDVVFRRHPDLVDPSLRSFLDRWTAVALERADRVITVSEFSKREIVDVYDVDHEKIHVVPNGVDRRFSTSSGPIQRPSVAPSGPFVLYVGSMEEKKNLPRLLTAWGNIKSRRSNDLTLVLVGGTGGQRFDVDAAIDASGHRASIRYLGRVSDEIVCGLMRTCAAFVYPSLYEGFGLPVLEAMACGAPVVTSSTTSLAEVAGEAALLVDPTDEEALARAIERVASDTDLARSLISKGRARAAEFTVERTARETVRVYEQALRS